MLESIFNQGTATIDMMMLVYSAMASLLFGLMIALTHKVTTSYNKNFLVTTTLLPLVVSAVILLVNGNLGMGIAVAGTFSLVRFRSLPGTSKEILTVFFAMTVGLATGMGFLTLGGLLTIIGCVVIIVLTKLPIFEVNKLEKNLKITIPEDLDYTEVFDDVLKKFTKHYELINVKTTALGSMFELKYSVVLKKNANEKAFLDELRVKNGNLKIILTHPTDYTDL